MTTAEKKARDLIASRTTEELVRDFETTEQLNTPEVPMIRGWMMDELEKRDAEAFDKWLESDCDSPRAFYLK